MRFRNSLLVSAGLSFCCSAASTKDRVIALTPTKYNGSSTVEFTTETLGQVDFFKLDPAPNATTWDSWYFEAINPTTNEVIVFNFEVQWPTEDGAGESETLYRLSLFGTFANGTAYTYVVDAENVNITERADKSMRIDYFGGNEFSWAGSSLLDPRPTYNVSINSPELGIKGSIFFQGSLAPPHYACGVDAAGTVEENVHGVAWANALPDANATVSLQIQNTTMSFDGYGYHDKTWADRLFQNAVQAAFWGHARLGPYAVVWWHSKAQDGTDISAEYLAEWENGHVIASRCVYDKPNNTLGWGEGQIWPLVPGTPPPKGMAIRWDIGDLGVFALNVTSNGVPFADIPFWYAGRGSVTGGFEGGESYTDVTAVWTLNQLTKL